MPRPTVIVALPLAWGVRNVLRSGLYDRLSAHCRVILGVPAVGRDSLLAEGIADDDLLTLEPPHETRVHSWLLRLLSHAQRARHPSYSDATLLAWNERSRGLRARARDSLFAVGGQLAQAAPIYAALERQRRRVAAATTDARIEAAIDQLRPIAALSTACVVGWEWPLFRALQRRGISTVAHILSFDNLTSRGYLPIGGFSHYLTWQPRMSEEIRTLYRVPHDQVTETGTPQFDFHVLPRYRWSRERTAERLSLTQRTPYLLYCANHHAITPSEPALVAALADRLASDATLGSHRLVVRLHPMDSYTRWDALPARCPQVCLSLPWAQGKAAYWAAPTDDDLALLGNSLRYADAALTVASTAALDAAIVDTPTVCIGFNADAPTLESRFYHDAHFSHHFRPIMQHGATPLARTMDELLHELRQATERPAALQNQRGSLVSDLCGTVDGGAAERIASAFLGCVH